jgi:hypothetical protein
MSKPWFLKMTLEAEKSPLATRIESILKPTTSELSKTTPEKLANGISERMQSAM